MREATNLKQRAAMVLQALVLCGLFVVAALSAGEQTAHAGDAALAHDQVTVAAPKG
ncbi:hypothetical protein [Niveispirillum sp.]|uniref:hypothetical protein n=1 Tax=Niveispirillum sp. TaxID=1917217 RepID=UPI001B6058C4|nr:hypothetical protein [Niveispirillum sp.]MBP7336605.1 hypothetical protein [Niveispirillum sp.]